MPEQNYPPPSDDAGAFTTPRQLNRWLDKNPQGGKLKRIRKYFSMPTFEIADRWDGYSDIVTAFNFSAAKNFSLKLNFAAPESPNYALCISYRIGNVVTRYLVWDAEGSNLNQDLDVYSGQPILKNFRLEVWNTSQGISSSDATIRFDTSILGPYDYMWQQDMVEANNDPQVIDFWADAYTSDNPSNMVPPGAMFTEQIDDEWVYQIGVTVGFTYQLFFAGGNYKLYSYSGGVFTLEASSGDVPFVAATPDRPYYLRDAVGPQPPDPYPVPQPPDIVLFGFSTNPTFSMPLTFPDNAVSVAN